MSGFVPAVGSGRRRVLTATFLRFALVGASGVVVNMLALHLLYRQAGLPLATASALAIELAIIHNFIWNHRWTFGFPTLAWAAFLRFNVVSLGGLVVATAVLWGLVTLAGLHYLIANAVGVVAATFWNFTANLFWTWGRRGGSL